jgi:hypothetical protein
MIGEISTGLSLEKFQGYIVSNNQKFNHFLSAIET